MSLVAWLVVIYVVWSVISAVRKSASGAAGQGTVVRSGRQSQEEALRRVLDALGGAEGRPSTRIGQMRAPADKTAVRVARRPLKRLESALPSEVTLDHDEEAEGVIRERRREVESRNRALAGDDHEAFDERMRRDDAAGVALSSGAASGTVRRLRNLVVWREVLGPPVSLRRER